MIERELIFRMLCELRKVSYNNFLITAYTPLTALFEGPFDFYLTVATIEDALLIRPTKTYFLMNYIGEEHNIVLDVIKGLTTHSEPLTPDLKFTLFEQFQEGFKSTTTHSSHPLNPFNEAEFYTSYDKFVNRINKAVGPYIRSQEYCAQNNK